jgi:hypothetical protein
MEEKYDEMFPDESEGNGTITSMGTTLVEEDKKDIMKLAIHLTIIQENLEKALAIIEKLKV